MPDYNSLPFKRNAFRFRLQCLIIIILHSSSFISCRPPSPTHPPYHSPGLFPDGLFDGTNESALNPKRLFSPGLIPDGHSDILNHEDLNPKHVFSPGFTPDGLFVNMTYADNVAFAFEKFVYLQTGTVLFSQDVPFKELVGNILGLINQVERLDPSVPSNGFIPISA